MVVQLGSTAPGVPNPRNDAKIVKTMRVDMLLGDRSVSSSTEGSEYLYKSTLFLFQTSDDEQIAVFPSKINMATKWQIMRYERLVVLL